jgi:hypothetical protein
MGRAWEAGLGERSGVNPDGQNGGVYGGNRVARVAYFGMMVALIAVAGIYAYEQFGWEATGVEIAGVAIGLPLVLLRQRRR